MWCVLVRVAAVGMKSHNQQQLEKERVYLTCTSDDSGLCEAGIQPSQRKGQRKLQELVLSSVM